MTNVTLLKSLALHCTVPYLGLVLIDLRSGISFNGESKKLSHLGLSVKDGLVTKTKQEMANS